MNRDKEFSPPSGLGEIVLEVCDLLPPISNGRKAPCFAGFGSYSRTIGLPVTWLCKPEVAGWSPVVSTPFFGSPKPSAITDRKAIGWLDGLRAIA